LNFSLPFLPLIVISFNVRILYSIRRSLCITRIEIKKSVIYTAEGEGIVALNGVCEPV
jgi:hypothetical protein